MFLYLKFVFYNANIRTPDAIRSKGRYLCYIFEIIKDFHLKYNVHVCNNSSDTLIF